MLDCIFTIDYEIYGNGEGSLRDLVLEPARRLKEVFDRAGAKLVVFVEALELEMIERAASDPAIDKVKNQIREFHRDGHEIGLHLHPQWAQARYDRGRWELDYGEYNLCALPRERMVQLVDRSIAYLQSLVSAPGFCPLSFRAGNWLFQPTATAARVLAGHGIRIDSSVFKGGLLHKHNLDYRPASKNGWCWRFEADVNVPDPQGLLIEMPIYTQMVPFWKLATAKRMGLQRKGAAGLRTSRDRLYRLLDLARFRHPLKFDFCRMTFPEAAGMVDSVVREDQQAPDHFRPFVAIGHTKDLEDLEAVENLLALLRKKAVPISTLREARRKWQN